MHVGCSWSFNTMLALTQVKPRQHLENLIIRYFCHINFPLLGLIGEAFKLDLLKLVFRGF